MFEMFIILRREWLSEEGRNVVDFKKACYIPVLPQNGDLIDCGEVVEWVDSRAFFLDDDGHLKRVEITVTNKCEKPVTDEEVSEYEKDGWFIDFADTYDNDFNTRNGSPAKF